MTKRPLHTGMDLFSTPANYFDELPERILNRALYEQPVQRLDTIPKKNCWKAPPEAYFNALPERIISSLPGDLEGAAADSSHTPVFRLTQYLRTGIAACLVLGMSILGILQIVGNSDTMMNPAYTGSAGREYPGELPFDMLELEEEVFVEQYLQAGGYPASPTSNPLEEYAVEHIEEDILVELY